jgi:hypothetical protein
MLDVSSCTIHLVIRFLYPLVISVHDAHIAEQRGKNELTGGK